MPQEQVKIDRPLSNDVARKIDEVCNEFRAALQNGAGVSVGRYLSRVDESAGKRLLVELVEVALEWLDQAGVAKPGDELLAANPALCEELASIIDARNEPPTIDMTRGYGKSHRSSGLVVRCPHCHGPIDLVVDASLMDIDCPSCGGKFSLVNESEATRDARVLSKVAHFELIERLGMGEFGTVWKARDTMLDRTVALKIPRGEQLDAVSIEKFMREARAAAQLNHPNIISTHEVGRDGDTLYIVHEYVRGVPLSDVVADHRLGVRESVLLMIKMADALEHAHQIGIIHRDLKPSNILVDDVGEPHLMDFGLAKRNDREITITTEGSILGTPAYMSPEQARGDSHDVDGRSDVYSLGVVLFLMLTGELPFRGSARMLLQKVLSDEPPGPRTLDASVPKDLDTICLKCLEKEPSRRYATASELAGDLRRYLAGEPVHARRIGPIGRGVRWARRNRATAALLAATIATLLTASIVSSYFGWRAALSAREADVQAQAVTDTLYDSLLQEIRLTREVRRQGYGNAVRSLVARTRNMEPSRVDLNELRRQLVLSMGDFVAYLPQIIRPPEPLTNSICLSPDGRQVLVGLSNGRLFAYDTTSGKEVDELIKFTASVQSIAISADGKKLVAAAQDGTARTWQRDGIGWQLQRTIKLDGQPESVFFVSGSGELLVHINGPVFEVWDLQTGDKLHKLPTHPEWTMRNAAIDVRNRRVAGSFMNENADTVGWAVWDLDSAERTHVEELPTLGNSYANGIDFTPDGSRLAIGFDEALLTYDLQDKQISEVRGVDSTKAVAFSPTKPYLATTNIRGWITVWRSITGREIATLQHPKHGSSRDDLTFSGDGSRLASSNANSIQVWDLEQSEEKTVLVGHNGGIPCAVFDPNGKTLVTGGKDDAIRYWNPATGELLHSIPLTAAVQWLAYSADGRILAVGCVGRLGAPHLKLIDVASREIVHESDPSLGAVCSVAWAEGKDARYLAASGLDGISLWKVFDAKDIQLDRIFGEKQKWCLATLLSPNGTSLVWVQDVRQLHTLDISTQRQKKLKAPPLLQGWHGVTFLPDGESVIYVSHSGTAQIWNIVDDRAVDSLGQSGTFGAPHIALSPNGKWFAALTQPDAVSIWHLPSKTHVFSLRPESGTVWSLAWDPSSEHLAVGQSEGSLAVWHLPKIQEKLNEVGLEWLEGE